MQTQYLIVTSSWLRDGVCCTVYSPESNVRRSGSYIYEDFMATDGTDVKVIFVLPFLHAQQVLKSRHLKLGMRILIHSDPDLASPNNFDLDTVLFSFNLVTVKSNHLQH